MSSPKPQTLNIKPYLQIEGGLRSADANIADDHMYDLSAQVETYNTAARSLSPQP